MKRSTRFLLNAALGVVCVVMLAVNSRGVSAQSDSGWTPFQRANGYLDDTLPPVMVSDHNRTVHAFASQWAGDEHPKRAIVYRQWTAAGGWTMPVDILLPPAGETQVFDAFLDEFDTIHLVYLAGNDDNRNVYYSHAPLSAAGRAPAWSKPQRIGPGALVPGSGAISGDGQGNLVIVYSANVAGNGVYAIHSANGGETWSEAAPIYLTYVKEQIPFSLQLTPERDGQVHGVWNVVDDKGNDIALYYARLTPRDGRWTMPMLLDERREGPGFFGPSFPAIVANGRDLLVMYNSGNPVADGEVPEGRPVQLVRRSVDGGDTWDRVSAPFPRHLGRSGSHALVVDDRGIAHALFIQRIEPRETGAYAPIGGLWHSEWRDSRWTEPRLIDLGAMSGHDVAAIVSQGNMLLVAMREDPGVAADGVWFVSTALAIPELPIATPIPFVPTATPTAVSEATVAATAVATPTSRPSPVDPGREDPPPGTGFAPASSPARPILLGLLPVVLLMGTYAALHRFRHSSHRRTR